MKAKIPRALDYIQIMRKLTNHLHKGQHQPESPRLCSWYWTTSSLMIWAMKAFTKEKQGKQCQTEYKCKWIWRRAEQAFVKPCFSSCFHLSLLRQLHIIIAFCIYRTKGDDMNIYPFFNQCYIISLFAKKNRANRANPSFSAFFLANVVPHLVIAPYPLTSTREVSEFEC